MADRQGQTHSALELRLEPSNPSKRPSVVYCAECRFLGSSTVISVQDDGTETMHTAVWRATVKLGKSL